MHLLRHEESATATARPFTTPRSSNSASPARTRSSATRSPAPLSTASIDRSAAGTLPPRRGPARGRDAAFPAGNLAVSSATKTSVSLDLGRLHDNVQVTGYRVYVNGNERLEPRRQPGATVSALACGTALTFEVDAPTPPATARPAPAGHRLDGARAGTRSRRARRRTSRRPRGRPRASRSPGRHRRTTSASPATASTAPATSSAPPRRRAGSSPGSAATPTTPSPSTPTMQPPTAPQKTTVMVSTTACVDATPPSAPTGFQASNVTKTGLTLTWNASTDNVSVAGYDVFRTAPRWRRSPRRRRLRAGSRRHLLLVRPRGARCRRQPLDPRERQRDDHELLPPPPPPLLRTRAGPTTITSAAPTRGTGPRRARRRPSA